MPDVSFISYWLALKVIGLQIITAGLLFLYFVPSISPPLADFVRRWGLWIGFLVALSAALTAQWYEWMGYLPCYWCWWGRIFHYPLIVLFGIAAWRKEASVALYATVLSVCGAGVSLYLHALQMGWIAAGPCAAVGGVDCASRTFFEFGYITFPLMQFSVFIFFIVLMLFQLQTKK